MDDVKSQQHYLRASCWVYQAFEFQGGEASKRGAATMRHILRGGNSCKSKLRVGCKKRQQHVLGR
eukprot:7548160-Pyramimonas_sp.AAC.1